MKSRKLLKRFPPLLLICSLLQSPVLLASPGDQVSSLIKGDRAPFDGLLMNRQLADRLEAEKATQVDKKIAAAELAAAVARSENDAKRDMAIQIGRYTALSEMHTQVVTVKDAQIEFLRKNYLPREWYESPIVLVGGGIIIGFGIILGGAHVVKTVR